jgi:hypothetical protein
VDSMPFYRAHNLRHEKAAFMVVNDGRYQGELATTTETRQAPRDNRVGWRPGTESDPPNIEYLGASVA